MRVLRYWRTVPLKSAPFKVSYNLVPVTKIKEEDHPFFEHILTAVKADNYLDYELTDVEKKPIEHRQVSPDAL